MEDQRLAVHRTIVVVDVEGFGDQRRTNRDQVAVRDGLYRVMREAFGRAGISWDDCGREDRGDGVFVLVPAEVPKGLLAESLPSALVTALRAHNGTHPGPERIRLRMALHAGEVHYDEHGVTAAAVNLAFRLLDAGASEGGPGQLAGCAGGDRLVMVLRGGGAAQRGRGRVSARRGGGEGDHDDRLDLPARSPGPGGPGDVGAPAGCGRGAGHAAGGGAAHAAARHGRVHRAHRRAGPAGPPSPRRRRPRQ